MKIQDILFIVLLIGLLIKHKENSFVSLGILCLLFAMPLFYFWVFFTAERLVYYGFVLILAEIILKIIKMRKE